MPPMPASSAVTTSPVAIASSDPSADLLQPSDESDSSDPKRSRTPAVLLLAGLGLLALGGGAFLLVTSDGDESLTTDDPAAVTTIAGTDDLPVATGAPSAAPITTPSPVTTFSPEATTVTVATVAPTTAPATTEPPSTAPPSTAPPSTAPSTTAAPTTTPAVAVPPASVPADADPAAVDVAESMATVRNGQIYLEGAVPTAEAGAAIAALAAEILGLDNVFNDDTVDPRAGDPNLGNITVEDTINFATGSSVILPGSDTLLNQGLALFSIRPSMTLVVVGHTDDRGSDEYNQQLSLDRAEAVVQWYADRDVDPARITARGAGESEPLESNDTAAGREQNRRIQFFLENILG